MHKAGRKYAPLTEKQREIVLDYLNNDETVEATAKRYGATKGALKYWIIKYRRREENLPLTDNPK